METSSDEKAAAAPQAQQQDNPREWKKSQKWIQILSMGSFTMLGPMCSSLPAPALKVISKTLNIHSGVEETMALSIFIIGFALGPLILAPLSEVYGRVIVTQVSNAILCIFNLACGFAHSKGQMLAFRLLAGAGGSGPMSIGAGMVADCFNVEDRGLAIAIYATGPVIGPAIGPVIGALVSDYSDWRWIFWSSSALSVVVSLGGLLLMKESHYPTIKRRRAKQRHMTLDDSSSGVEMDFLLNSLIRPFRLMFTQRIIIALSLWIPFLYGIVYLVFSTFFSVFNNPSNYNQRTSIAGLHYIALTIGFFIGAQIRAPIGDAIFHHLTAKANGTSKPEFRLPPILLGAVLAPAGLIIYGWAAEHRTFWLVTDLGAALFAAGSIISFASTQAYIIDAYTTNASSAMAASTTLRSLAGFALPLIGPEMYERMGLGWGNTMLALVSLIVGVPSPILLWIYGPRLRESSQYAAFVGE